MTVEEKLTAVFSEFARTLATDFPIQGILDHLVVSIVGALPIDAAGVTLIAPGLSPRYVAASNEAAMRFEQLQSDLGEGPCVVAYATGESVSIADLREANQFHVFSPRALDEGLSAVFTFPLRHESERLGALDLYRMSPGDLDVKEMAAAQSLADVATAYLLNARARADLQESSVRAHHTALHDGLTGLPNRMLLAERLTHAVDRCGRSGKAVAILYVDLDKFKAVNDVYGHQMGDELLVAVGARLTQLVRPGDTVARLSGDEFVVLCEDIDDPAVADSLATRIGNALSEPFEINGADLHISASVGIAFSGAGTDVPEQVLQEADTAMYMSKRAGGGSHTTLDLREYSTATQRTNLNHDLRSALDRREIYCDYQPIVATDGGRVVGAEALVRWAHPVQGIIAPDVLIPLAERSGLINQIGRWVLVQACEDRQRWLQGHADETFQVSVNVSPRQLMAPGFAQVVEDVLRETGTDSRRITLEVTESVFVHDVQRVQRVLADLQQLGVHLALDDFGTGYSSLGYLKQFPVDILKVDRLFVRDIDTDVESCLIVGAIVNLAHALHILVVAEGIETAAQYNRVAAFGAEACQGFYFARPMSAEAIEDLMSSPLAANCTPCEPHHHLGDPTDGMLLRRRPSPTT